MRFAGIIGTVPSAYLKRLPNCALCAASSPSAVPARLIVRPCNRRRNTGAEAKKCGVAPARRCSVDLPEQPPVSFRSAASLLGLSAMTGRPRARPKASGAGIKHLQRGQTNFPCVIRTRLSLTDSVIKMRHRGVSGAQIKCACTEWAISLELRSTRPVSAVVRIFGNWP